MPIDIEVRVSGTTPDQMLRGYTQVATALQDWKRPFQAMAVEYAAYEEHVFASEGSAHLKGQWKALSPRYAAWKAIHYPGRPILTRTGALRRAAGEIRELAKARLAMGPGTTIAYAAAAASVRPFLEPSPVIIQRLQDIANQFVSRTIRAGGPASG